MSEEGQAEVLAPVAEQAPPAPDAVETASAAELPSNGEEQQPDSEKTFTQKELDEIIAKRIAKAERKAQREAQREFDRRLAESLKAIPKPEIIDTEGKPDPSRYQSVDEFASDMERWAEKQAQKRLEEKAAQTQQERAREEEQRALHSYHEREDDARDRYADFDSIAYQTPYECSDVMAQAIKYSEMGPDIAYFFGKNPSEAQRISRLPPLLAVKEIGKLEMKISSEPTAKQPTSAPAPIRPVGSKGSAPITDTLNPKSLEQMGTSAWIAAERERQAKRRGANR